jgi:modulator of FtsH protease HflK
LRRLRDRFGRMFGGGSGGGLFIVAIGILLAWVLFDSVSMINAREVGVVLRFGRENRTLQPGLNLKWPRPIEMVAKVEMQKVRLLSDSVRMLTNDENIVMIDFNVQYQVVVAKDYLFKVKDPEETLKQAAESAVRQVIGGSSMDTILSGQGAELVAATKVVLQQTLDSYSSGITVTEVNFQTVAPPHEVKEAFDDVTNARENKQQIENVAQAYANKVVPEARGEAARIKAQSEGFRAERIARAKGDAERFNLLFAQYKSAPEVTRKRLYLETLQQVYSESVKILDGSSGKNLISLPLDRLMGGQEGGATATIGAMVQDPQTDAARTPRAEGSR